MRAGKHGRGLGRLPFQVEQTSGGVEPLRGGAGGRGLRGIALGLSELCDGMDEGVQLPEQGLELPGLAWKGSAKGEQGGASPAHAYPSALLRWDGIAARA